MAPAYAAEPLPSEPSPATASSASPRETAKAGRWPHALSHEPIMRVSDVLALIQPEFPALTPSKLRFLDAQGLVVPQRTGSGYRQYSPADAERLRFVLREQRDHYRPLSVIAERLAELDAGTATEAVVPHEVSDEAAPWVDADELASLAGTEPTLVAALDEAGLLPTRMPGRYPRASIAVVRAAADYVEAGGDVRAARVVGNAATREADQARKLAAPIRATGRAGEAENAADELGEAAIRLFGAVMRRSLESD
jgi:DNA-binding transcriptional MerR regulator